MNQISTRLEVLVQRKAGLEGMLKSRFRKGRHTLSPPDVSDLSAALRKVKHEINLERQKQKNKATQRKDPK